MENVKMSKMSNLKEKRLKKNNNKMMIRIHLRKAIKKIKEVHHILRLLRHIKEDTKILDHLDYLKILD
jgi:hypothetical protein